MKKKYVRIGFTQAQKTELWERWRRGEQMKSTMGIPFPSIGPALLWKRLKRVNNIDNDLVNI